jgi:hypothetical protein
MQKLSNFTGQARHGWEKMTPSAFGMGRSPHDPLGGQQGQHPSGSQHHLKRGTGLSGGPLSPLPPSIDAIVTLSFNVPFSSNLSGPLSEEILHASPGAAQRWIFPEGTDAASTPPHKLPVHARNEELLRQLCKALTDNSGGRLEAAVTATEPKPTPASQRLPRKGLVTNVCVSGDGELVHKMRAKILNETPIALVCVGQGGGCDGQLLTRARNARSSKWTRNTCSTSTWIASVRTSSNTST